MVLAPFDFCNIKANVKVTSTENGIIFGNIVYDVTGTTVLLYILQATTRPTEDGIPELTRIPGKMATTKNFI